MAYINRNRTTQIKEMIGGTDSDQAVILDDLSRFPEEFLFEVKIDQGADIACSEKSEDG